MPVSADTRPETGNTALLLCRVAPPTLQYFIDMTCPAARRSRPAVPSLALG